MPMHALARLILLFGCLFTTEQLHAQNTNEAKVGPKEVLRIKPKLRLPRTPGQTGGDVWFAPDGKLIAISDRDAFKSQNRIVVYEPDSGQEKLSVDLPQSGKSWSMGGRPLGFTPDGSGLHWVSGNFTKEGLTVSVFDLKCKAVSSVKLPEGERFSGFLMNGKHFVVSSKEGTTVRDLKGARVRELKIRSGTLGPDCKLSCAFVSENTFEIWSMETEEKIVTIKNDKTQITSVQFHPSGKWTLEPSLKRL